MLEQFLKDIKAGDLIELGPATLGIVGGVIVASIYMVMTNWRRVRQHQLDVALKRDMLDRGMTAGEIERVMGLRSSEVEELPPRPTPSDVVVESDGDWYPAILLKIEGEKCYILFKGNDEEEWVSIDRVRFPAQAGGTPANEQQGAPTGAQA